MSGRLLHGGGHGYPVSLHVTPADPDPDGCGGKDVLLPRRWVVDASRAQDEGPFAWATRCRRLVEDRERYASTLAGLHLVAFACLMLGRAGRLITGS